MFQTNIACRLPNQKAQSANELHNYWSFYLSSEKGDNVNFFMWILKLFNDKQWLKTALFFTQTILTMLLFTIVHQRYMVPKKQNVKQLIIFLNEVENP